MSEQWAIENDTGADLTVRAPNGFAVELDANSADPRERFAYFAIRQQALDLEQLRADLAAAVAERDRIKGDYDDAAHFARHFIRDDAEVTPRAAIIRLGDKCTSLFARMKIAETERDEWIACHAQLYRRLGSLLAVIHRDGGHYESEHGTEKACADAELAVHVQRGIADGYHDALKIWRQRAEQAEARLAALDASPTVAVAQHVIGPNDEPYAYLSYTHADVPAHDVELIARPAKEAQP